jgi:hypothetical protein
MKGRVLEKRIHYRSLVLSSVEKSTEQPEFRWNKNHWEVKVGKVWKRYLRPAKRQALSPGQVLHEALETKKPQP